MNKDKASNNQTTTSKGKMVDDQAKEAPEDDGFTQVTRKRNKNVSNKNGPNQGSKIDYDAGKNTTAKNKQVNETQKVITKQQSTKETHQEVNTTVETSIKIENGPTANVQDKEIPQDDTQSQVHEKIHNATIKNDKRTKGKKKNKKDIVSTNLKMKDMVWARQLKKLQ